MARENDLLRVLRGLFFLPGSPAPVHFLSRRPRIRCLRVNGGPDVAMLKRGESYEEVYAALKWEIPRVYNMAYDVCDRHAAEPGRTALIYFDERGLEHRYAFNEIRDIANKLANALTALGIRRGDRVAILLPQSPETAITHVALYKMGAVALPLFTLFGEDALEYRLGNSGAAAVVTNPENLPKVAAI